MGTLIFRSRYASLTVLVPAELPVIFPQTLVYKTVEGSEVELRCEARGGKPVSEVSYWTFLLSLRLKSVKMAAENVSQGHIF